MYTKELVCFISPLPFNASTTGRNGWPIPSTSRRRSVPRASAGSQPGHFLKRRMEALRRLASSAPTLAHLSTLARMSTFDRLQSVVTAKAMETFAPDPLDHLCPVPTEPPFDRIMALALTTYAFRAYQEPPSSSYREVFSSAAPTNMSKVGRIICDIVYISTEQIRAFVTGVFMFTIIGPDAYATCQINQVILRDALRTRNFTIIRIVGDDDFDDELLIKIYLSEEDDESTPAYQTSIPLNELVNNAMATKEKVDLEPVTLDLERIIEGRRKNVFFQLSMVQKEMGMPFFPEQDKDESISKLDQTISIKAEVSFVPLNIDARNEITPRSDSKEEKEENVTNVLHALEALQEAVREAMGEQLGAEKNLSTGDRSRRDIMSLIAASQLEPGQMPVPTDWERLTEVAKSVAAEIQEQLPETLEKEGWLPLLKTIEFDAKASLFIESLDTDTELWLFHDEARKVVVVSFRGTEQIKWKDFFTDAQVFLQCWKPGEEINLTVEMGRTVGLADFVPDIVSKGVNRESVPDDASAVHYGFLRAYLSVRDAMLRGIGMLAKDEGYKILFTGHSLGGALATLAAGDFAVRTEGFDIRCMSFGAPKVGNINFARIFNELVPNAFRIVNDSDVVSRMPRSLSGSGPVDRYRHSGRTVLVHNDGAVWVEGENDHLLDDETTSVANPFREKYEDLSDLFQYEQDLWKELISGRSVKRHMVRRIVAAHLLFEVNVALDQVPNDHDHLFYAFSFCRRTPTSRLYATP